MASWVVAHDRAVFTMTGGCVEEFAEFFTLGFEVYLDVDGIYCKCKEDCDDEDVQNDVGRHVWILYSSF